jgi:hypothetical protein
MLDCPLRLPLDTASLVFKPRLFCATQLEDVLPDVGILVMQPTVMTSSALYKDIEDELDKYTRTYYGRVPREGDPDYDLTPGSIACGKALDGLTQTGVESTTSMAAVADVELMERVLRGGRSLSPSEKNTVRATLKERVYMPRRANSAPAGTLQPLALGLGCAHLLCSTSVRGPAE